MHVTFLQRFSYLVLCFWDFIFLLRSLFLLFFVWLYSINWINFIYPLTNFLLRSCHLHFFTMKDCTVMSTRKNVSEHRSFNLLCGPTGEWLSSFSSNIDSPNGPQSPNSYAHQQYLGVPICHIFSPNLALIKISFANWMGDKCNLVVSICFSMITFGVFTG